MEFPVGGVSVLDLGDHTYLGAGLCVCDVQIQSAGNYLSQRTRGRTDGQTDGNVGRAACRGVRPPPLQTVWKSGPLAPLRRPDLLPRPND